MLIASSTKNVILGAGTTGLSIARFLSRCNQSFIVMDSQQHPVKKEEFENEFSNSSYCWGGLRSEILLQADRLLISPGISQKEPAIETAINAGVPILGDIELFAQALANSNTKIPVIAITGTNGKTTVTTWVTKLLEAQGKKVGLCGNIGTPALDLLLETVDVYVLELSSFQLETVSSLKPEIACVLNVTKDHLDRYNSFEEYHRAKQRIYRNAKKVVCNREDPLTHPLLSKQVKSFHFGKGEPDKQGFGLREKQGEQWIAHEFTDLVAVDELSIKGRQSIENCLSALAIGFAFGLSIPLMLKTLKSVQPLEHRFQKLPSINGVSFINDSKATNIPATQAALSNFAECNKSVLLILGGKNKGIDFRELAESMVPCVKLAILMGESADEIFAAVKERVDAHKVENLNAAIQTAYALASPGDTVLLSPACASFDKFKSYADRGNQFVALVESLLMTEGLSKEKSLQGQVENGREQ